MYSKVEIRSLKRDIMLNFLSLVSSVKCKELAKSGVAGLVSDTSKMFPLLHPKDAYLLSSFLERLQNRMANFIGKANSFFSIGDVVDFFNRNGVKENGIVAGCAYDEAVNGR